MALVGQFAALPLLLQRLGLFFDLVLQCDPSPLLQEVESQLEELRH